MEEIGKWIAIGALFSLAFFAKAASGGSWPKGALIVVAVALPSAMIFDVLTDGSGVAAWVFAATGAALIVHLLVSLGGMFAYDGDEEDGGDGGGFE